MDFLKKAYEAFEDYFCGGMLFLGLSLVMTNVVLRYFFGRPQSILDEFSVYFVVWGTLCGIAVALRNNHHIKVDLLFNLLPMHVRRWVSVTAHLIGITFAFFYTFYGFQLVAKYWQSGQASADSRFPLWIVSLVLPVSGALFIIRYADKLLFHFKNGGRDWEMAQGRGFSMDGDGTAL